MELAIQGLDDDKATHTHLCNAQACRRGFQADVPRLVSGARSPIAWHLDCYQLWPMLPRNVATIAGINALHPAHQVSAPCGQLDASDMYTAAQASAVCAAGGLLCWSRAECRIQRAALPFACRASGGGTVSYGLTITMIWEATALYGAAVMVVLCAG